jgi:hypothetical protein
MTVSELRERLRKIKDEEQRMNVQGYSANPWAKHQLANSKGGTGTDSRPAWPPRQVLVRPDDSGRWIVEADGREFGGQNATEAENAMRAFYGQAPLRAEWRDPRDDARPADE